MSDTQASEQTRPKLSTASIILGLALFTTLCISLCIRQYFTSTSGRPWPWSSDTTWARNLRRSVERQFSEDEPRTIAIGGRAKTLRMPLMWDAYIQTERLLKYDKTEERTAKTPERPLESKLASLQPVSIQMLTPHTAGPVCSGPLLPSLLLAPATPPHPPRATESTPHTLPRAAPVALYPHGTQPTPLFQRRAAPQVPASTSPHSHADVPISVSSPLTSIRLNPQESPTLTPSELSQYPPSTSTLAPHPLQLTFLITLPDPSFPSHSPPPHPPKSRLPPTASSISPIFGILTPPPTFLLPSLTVPAASLANWWDLPHELSRAEGNRAPGWGFHLREQEARARVSAGDGMASVLQWSGRAVRRRG